MVALNNLAWLNQQRGDLKKARELAEKAVAAAPPTAPATGMIKDTLGWVMLAQGDVQAALPQLEAASAALPGEPGNQISRRRCAAARRARVRCPCRAGKLLSSGVSFASKAEAEQLLDELKRG